MNFDFLISSERSGSNLLVAMLDSHPDICAPSPTHLLRRLLFNRFRYGNLQHDENWEKLTNDAALLLTHQIGKWQTIWTGEEIRNAVENRTLASIIKKVYFVEAKTNNKKRVFIKENQTHKLVLYILRHFADTKFIFLVRDPRDMVASHAFTPGRKGGVIEGANRWKEDQKETLLTISSFSDPVLFDTSRFLVVHYEDILENGEAECSRICDFLSVPYSEAMLAYHNKKDIRERAKKTACWENLDKPIMRNNSKKYNKLLSKDQIKYIEVFCADEMDILGYNKEYPEEDINKLRQNVKICDEIIIRDKKDFEQSEKNRRAIIKKALNQIGSHHHHSIIRY